MAFRQEDFKKTTRKGADGGPASVYPHQIKDKKAVARLEIAIRTFDAAVGKRRRDMDAQAMTDFFGDPRLARGVVACLGQFYRYETPDFARMVGRAAAARLREAGLTRPAEVRAYTYASVNDEHGGFLPEAQRAGCYEALGGRFGLSAHQWDTLLHLDAEDNQILSRLGAAPAPADLVALYNFHALDTVLRRATQLTLFGLSLSTAQSADVRALAKGLGLRAVVSGEGGTLTLTEAPQDRGGGAALFPRRAGRLARCFLLLTQSYATRGTTGFADARISAKPFRLTLGADALRALGMPTRRAEAADDKPALRKRLEAGQALHKDLLKRRARGEAGGWRLKRLPEPVVNAAGVLLPDFTLTRDGVAVQVLLGPDAPGDWGAPLLCLPPGRKAPDAGDVLARADALTDSLFALPPAALPAVPGDVLSLCDRAASEGMVRAADARRALHLLDESPLIEWVRRAADPRVRYIPGVGLCSREMVAAIQGHAEA